MTSPIRFFFGECRYIIHSIVNCEAKKIKETFKRLGKLQLSTNYQLESLRLKKITPWKSFWRVLLKDAEQLRKNGQADLSLAALNAAKDSGLTNPWIEASRAKSYEKLSQWPKALAIWDELSICKNKDVSRIAIKNLNNHPNKINALISNLNTVIHLSGNEARFLPQATPTCLQELEDPILAEVANLEESKSLKVSARILKNCIAAGLSSRLIKEKLASLLCELEQNKEAITLWQSLLNSKEIKIRTLSKKNLKRMSKKFLDRLRSIIERKGQPILHLPKTAPSTLSELESAIIKETDALRKAKSNDCSLLILETSIMWGIDTDMIKAKKARTLLSMKKYNEAVILLTPLLTSDNKKAKQIAQNLIKRCPKESQMTIINPKINNILRKADDSEKSIESTLELLADEILKDPKNDQLHKALQEVAMKRSRLNNYKNQQFKEELTLYMQERAGLEAFLEIMEYRHSKKAIKSSTNQST